MRSSELPMVTLPQTNEDAIYNIEYIQYIIFFPISVSLKIGYNSGIPQNGY